MTGAVSASPRAKSPTSAAVPSLAMHASTPHWQALYPRLPTSAQATLRCSDRAPSGAGGPGMDGANELRITGEPAKLSRWGAGAGATLRPSGHKAPRRVENSDVSTAARPLSRAPSHLLHHLGRHLHRHAALQQVDAHDERRSAGVARAHEPLDAGEGSGDDPDAITGLDPRHRTHPVAGGDDTADRLQLLVGDLVQGIPPLAED